LGILGTANLAHLKNAMHNAHYDAGGDRDHWKLGRSSQVVRRFVGVDYIMIRLTDRFPGTSLWLIPLTGASPILRHIKVAPSNISKTHLEPSNLPLRTLRLWARAPRHTGPAPSSCR
jgi:hypothetical protein